MVDVDGIPLRSGLTRVGGQMAPSLHSSNEPVKLLQVAITTIVLIDAVPSIAESE